MRRRSILLVSILILTIFLTGCTGGVVIPSTDGAAVKGVIQDYFLAINDQNWNQAKNCCVYGSDRYYATCVLEDAVNALYQYFYTVTITCFVNISNVSVNGSYASAYLSGSIIITADYYSESESSSGYCYLQKVGSTWKIYAP